MDYIEPLTGMKYRESTDEISVLRLQLFHILLYFAVKINCLPNGNFEILGSTAMTSLSNELDLK